METDGAAVRGIFGPGLILLRLPVIVKKGSLLFVDCSANKHFHYFIIIFL